MSDQKEKAAEAQFMIQRVYVKDSSYEAPGVPAMFQEAWEPELSLDLNTEYNALENEVYEVILTLTATVKNKGAVAFLSEIKQAGIFTVQGAPVEQLSHILESFCPNILFPYAREAITAQVIRGSFPQLVLAPINFDALYAQKMEQKKTQLASADA